MAKSKSNTTSAISPIGRFIDAPKNRWRIGSEIGSGACGSVHELGKCSSSGQQDRSCWVVKVAPTSLPTSNSTATSKRKKKRSAVEINADLLFYEVTLYRNGLADLQGTMIPNVPMGSGSKHPVGFGDIEGFRFIVMERMEGPLSSIVPILHQNSLQPSSSSKKKRSNSRGSSKTTSATCVVPLGKTASRLITLLEHIHNANLVFVDVKPENFMIAPSSPEETLEDSIRMIDLGLVQSYIDVTIRKSNRHRIDEQSGSVAGTPLYASCHVLRGHTVSRRDDLEACGYVICELILQVMDYASTYGGGSSSDRRKQVDVKDNLLPWSGGTSDEHVLQLKEAALSGNDGGAFWNSLSNGKGNKKYAANIMEEYFGIVSNMEYAAKPDYDTLRSILGKLQVSSVDCGDDTGVENTSTSKTCGNISEEKEEEEEEEEESESSENMVSKSNSSQRRHKDLDPGRQRTRNSTRHVTRSKQNDFKDCSEDEDTIDCTEKEEEEELDRNEVCNDDSSSQNDDTTSHRRTTRSSTRRRAMHPSSNMSTTTSTKSCTNTDGNINITSDTQPSRKRKTRRTTEKTFSSNCGSDGLQNSSNDKACEKIEKNAASKQRKKRVTQTERFTTFSSNCDSDSDELQNPSNDETCERIEKNVAPKQRKKRVTQIERVTTTTTTTTVELIDSSDNDRDDDDDNFMDAGEFEEDPVAQSPIEVVQARLRSRGGTYHTCQNETDNSDDDGMEMMTTCEEDELDHGSFMSCPDTIPNACDDGNVAIPMDIDITNENEKENFVNVIPSAEVEYSIDGASFKTASSSSSRSMKKKSAAVAKKRSTLKLVCVKGPHEGEIIEIKDMVTFGQNPRTETHYNLGKDEEVSAAHAKIVLNKSGKGKNTVLSIRVTDLKSANGTFVNGKIIPSGRGRQAFVGNSLQFGDSVFKIKNI